MAIAQRNIFFNGPYNTQLAQEVIANDPDIYILKWHYAGSGVYAQTSIGTSTLTPAVSPAWTPDDWISTSAYNLFGVDDNEKAWKTLITDNIATAVTFDETAAVLCEDETTAPTFTSGQTYDFYVLTPCNERAYGYFWGHMKTGELNIANEYKKYLSRDPQELIYKNILSKMLELTIGYVHTANEDLQDLCGMDTYGSQTAQAQYGIGAAETADNFYQIIYLGKDNNNKNVQLTFWKVQFDLTGNLFNKGDSGHREYPLHGDILANQIIEDKDSRYGTIILAD